ncbi:SEL1-like repeat protein [Moritella sp.]|uniref:SEL1-like repeat protein n=1 Tax=Moritella sp. TaxID=78556 RepID=UPI001DE38D7D|nr:SEL1-like repeat protein [Moritella sp.]MCJ8349581.1 SEL1-like repeat protein [Moritella sp.]NQZ41515.1 SEL1-like repeat protein [Moritella sp.]
MGDFYYEDSLIDADNKKSIHWFEKSAELGDVRSAYQVGYALRVSSLAVVVRYKSSEHSYFAA